MAFRDDVRAALAKPVGEPLQRTVRSGAITAILVEGGDPERESVALGELSRELERAGVAVGRQFVLGVRNAAPGSSPRAPRGLAHDPDRGAVFTAGELADGLRVELDDELREAEGVVLIGRFAADAVAGIVGGPATLWPGLAPARGRRAFAERVGTAPPAMRTAAALALALAAHTLCPAGFALLWSAEATPRVLAGTPEHAFAACVAAGWLADREPSA